MAQDDIDSSLVFEGFYSEQLRQLYDCHNEEKEENGFAMIVAKKR